MRIERWGTIVPNFLRHPFTKVVIAAALLATVYKVVSIFLLNSHKKPPPDTEQQTFKLKQRLLQLTKKVCDDYYNDPKVYNYHQRVLTFQQAKEDWENNSSNQDSLNKLIAAIGRVVYHTFFLFLYQKQGGRIGVFIKDWEGRLEEIYNIVNNQKQTLKEETIKKAINQLELLNKISEKNFNFKRVALEQLKVDKQQGLDYLHNKLYTLTLDEVNSLVTPNLSEQLHATNHLNSTLPWYRFIVRENRWDAKSCTLPNEYDYKQYNKINLYHWKKIEMQKWFLSLSP